jgi:ATP-dependent DNA helicase RecG
LEREPSTDFSPEGTGIVTFEDEEVYKTFTNDLAVGESQTVEFKERFPDDARELAKEIAAFATSNLGRIYLGVNDNGDVVGLPDIRGLQDVKGKDLIQQRISGLKRKVDPPVKVQVCFLEKEGYVVALVVVPKGSEPVYYADSIPYVRDLSTSRRATASEVKELHRQFFERSAEIEQPDPMQMFLTGTVLQLADLELIWSDHENRDVNPDLAQMQYDLGAIGRSLLDLSSDPVAQKLGVSEELRTVGEKLEDMEAHIFYLGRASWNNFVAKGNECADLGRRLTAQLKKLLVPLESQLPQFSDSVRKNVAELRILWNNAPRYQHRGQLGYLKDSLRRLASTFYRLSVLPYSSFYPGLTPMLGQLGQSLREISSVKYFHEFIGSDAIKQITDPMEENIRVAYRISKSLNSTSAPE